jgi:hypothetical protein
MLTVPLVSADVSVTIYPVKDLILAGESAVFDILIANHQERADSFRISTSDIGWMINSEKGVIDVPAGSSKRVTIDVTPIGEKKSAVYSLDLRVYSQETGTADKSELVIRAVDYKDLISAKVTIPKTGLDSKKSNVIILELANKYKIPLDNLEIIFNSDIFSARATTDLNLEQTKEIRLRADLKEGTEEGLYDVQLLIRRDGKVFVDRMEKLNVGQYSNIQQAEKSENEFLLSRQVISKTNMGNSNVYETYTRTFGVWERKFTDFEPSPAEKSGNVYKWVFSLRPGETYTITLTTDYRTPIVLLVIILIVGWVAYDFFRNPVSIKKKVLTIRSGEGLSEMKTLLIVKNNSNYEVREIKVLDTLPRTVKEPTDFGTMKPKMLKKGEDRMSMLWEIPTLMKGEERILSYRIKSRIKILGKMIIPRAICSYRSKSKKKVVVSSNKIVLFS